MAGYGGIRAAAGSPAAPLEIVEIEADCVYVAVACDRYCGDEGDEGDDEDDVGVSFPPWRLHWLVIAIGWRCVFD